MPAHSRTAAAPKRGRKAPTAGKAFRYPGASTNPLTGKQKGIICMLAQRAHKKRNVGYAVEVWRHEQVELAIGQESLRLATQGDYNSLVAHFENMAGEGGKAFQAAYRDHDEAKRQQRHLLEDALNDRELDLAYAEKICRTQYKRGLDDATPDQLARIKFTVKNRRPVKLATATTTAPDPF